jgi:hypothetical protein
MLFRAPLARTPNACLVYTSRSLFRASNRLYPNDIRRAAFEPVPDLRSPPSSATARHDGAFGGYLRVSTYCRVCHQMNRTHPHLTLRVDQP